MRQNRVAVSVALATMLAKLWNRQHRQDKCSGWRFVFLAFVVFSVAAASGQTLVQRLRVGNSTEGITVATLDDSRAVVTLDGWDVFAVPPGSQAATKLFDLRGRGLIAQPNAIAFARGSFYFADTASGQQLWVTDAKGKALPLLQLRFAPGTTANVFYREGLSYNPATKHLVSMTILPDLTYRIQFIQPNGLVDSEIPLNIDPSLYPVGITVHPSLGLLVSGGNQVLSVDSSGNTTSIIPLGLATTDLEGLAAFPDGRLAVCDLTAGHLFMYNAQLSRLPTQERDYRLGAGVRPQFDTDFDPTSGGFFVVGSTATEGNLLLQVSSDGSFSRVIAVMDQLSSFPPVRSVNWSAFDQQIVVADAQNIYFLDPASGQTLLHIDGSGLGYNIRSALVLSDGRILVLQNDGLTFHFLAHALGDSGSQVAVETGSVPLTLQAPTRAHLYGTNVISGNVVYNLSGVGSTQIPASFFDGDIFPVFSISSGPLAGKLGEVDPGAITIFSLP